MATRITPDSDAVTVLIPTFNRRALLERAIESVRSTCDVEVVISIFDNASQDGTQEYLTKLARENPMVRYHRHSSNIGGVENFKFALSSVDTKYFIPLADDDYIIDGFIKKSHSIMQSDTRLGAAIFYTEERDSQGTLLTTYPADRTRIEFGRLKPREHMRDWITYSHYAWSSVLWRSTVLGIVGSPYIHTGMPSDVDFQAQVFSEVDVYIVDEPGAVYSSHPGQASRTMNMSDIGSCAALFDRLDRKILDRDLFSLDEYLPMREAMWNRFRWLWNILPPEGLTGLDVREIAAVAGFRLGDWNLAFWLFDQVEPAADLSHAKNWSAPFRTLPDARELGGPRVIATGVDALRWETILWFKKALEEKRELEARLAAFEDRAALAEQKATEHAGLSATLQDRSNAYAAATASVNRNPLMRSLRRLGLLRPPAY